MLKRKPILFLLLTLAVTLFAATGAVSGKTAEMTEKNVNPLFDNKETLYYLFWTKDDKLKKDVTDLQATLDLSDEQMAELKSLGLEERNASRVLQTKAQELTVQSFNDQAARIFEERNKSLQSLLGSKYEVFSEWLTEWWANEREYRKNWLKEKNSGIGVSADIDRVSGIWATQFNPNTPGAYEVALPDKYVKFANLGWWSDIPDNLEPNYDSPEYTVNVYYPDTNKSVLGVPVDESGPWNTNDNYWDSANGINPRRFGSDLDLGQPAAAAAYYDDWNDGKDERGRLVLNPAGIDLTPDVAKDLGLGPNESAFVDVRYSDLP